MPLPPKTSRDSLRRFVKFFLSLKTPHFLFHQTLTFSPPILDATAAKRQLNRLLKSRFIKGAFYVEERQGRKGIHYHVLLFFYKEHGLPFAPSKMFEGIRAQVFHSWNSYNGEKLAQKANEMKMGTLYFAALDYLTKETRYRSAKGKTNWWGKHEGKNLVKKPNPPTKQEVSATMDRLLLTKVKLPLGLLCSARDLQWEKRDFKANSLSPNEEWEQAKRRETGRKDRVTDEDLLAFRKMKAADWLKKQRAL